MVINIAMTSAMAAVCLAAVAMTPKHAPIGRRRLAAVR
jgi:hypothetical protein